MMKLEVTGWQHGADFDTTVLRHDAKDAERDANHTIAHHAQDVVDRAALQDQMCKVLWV